MRTLSWMLLLGLVGCGDPPGAGGGQFGQETNDGASCVEVERTPLADDEISPLGFSPQELRDWVIGDHAETLTWSDGTATDLTFSLSNPGSADYVVYAADYGDSSGGIEPAIALECPAMVELGVDVLLTTADGAFQESLSLTIKTDTVDAVGLGWSLDAVSGSFDVWDWATESYDDAWAELALWLEADAGLSGEVSGYGEETHGSGPDGAVSLSLFEIAVIGSMSSADE